jgi:hypothetical protein
MNYKYTSLVLTAMLLSTIVCVRSANADSKEEKQGTDWGSLLPIYLFVRSRDGRKFGLAWNPGRVSSATPL